MLKVENVIVGAGAYGLSIASHLRAENIEALVVGRPMETWHANMPLGMILKSETFASNLWDPQRQYTFERFYGLRNMPYRPVGNPLPLGVFVDYAQWFRQHAAPDVTDATLAGLSRADHGFALDFSDGSTLSARRVILAMGYLGFASMPPVLDSCPRELASHSSHHRDLARLAGKDVTVVGCGQSGLETAALLHERGADVRILARAPGVEWNLDPNASRSMLSQLRRPDAGLGAGWQSLLVSELPKSFRRLPARTRHRFVLRSWGPSGGWWLKDRVVSRFPVLTSHAIAHAAERGGKLDL